MVPCHMDWDFFGGSSPFFLFTLTKAEDLTSICGGAKEFFLRVVSSPPYTEIYDEEPKSREFTRFQN